jgi:hypothetical protein
VRAHDRGRGPVGHGAGQRCADLPDPAGRGVSGRVLIIVEDIPAAMDYRVMKQIDTLLDNGYEVRVISDHKKGSSQQALQVRARRNRSASTSFEGDPMQPPTATIV